MKIAWKILLLTSTLLVSLGGILHAEDSVEDYAEEIEIDHDDFKKLTEYVADDVSDSSGDDLFLRAWKYDKDGSIDYQIYVSDQFGKDWRNYNEVYDSNGLKLEVTAIDHKITYKDAFGSIYQEQIGVKVSRQYLEDNKLKGIRFQVSGSGGKEQLTLPANYIQAFLSVVE